MQQMLLSLLVGLVLWVASLQPLLNREYDMAENIADKYDATGKSSGLMAKVDKTKKADKVEGQPWYANFVGMWYNSDDTAGKEASSVAALAQDMPDIKEVISKYPSEGNNLEGRLAGQLGFASTNTNDASSAVADAIIAAPVAASDAAPVAVERSGLMARPASDAAPTATESPATPEVAASQAGAWLTTAVDAILLTEGGYQKDLEDTGNYRPDGTLVGTNRGVTALALAAYKGVDANTITEADIKAITDQDAKDIFIEDYYYKPKIDKLPDNIKEAVFDMNINSGSNSITILQRLAGLTGDAVDGGVGPDTLKAIEKANITPDQYADARIKYYKEVVKKTPAKKKYLDGWINRANEYRE
jgi:hypothetical protein